MKKRISGMFKKTILLWIIAFFFVSCGKDTANYTVEEIGGTRIIHNQSPKWGEEPEVELEFVRKIGGSIDEIDENYQFFNTRAALMDDNGDLYVLDVGNSRVQKFDKNGRYVMTIGSQGQGPGELLNPSGMIIDKDNILHILNSGNLRIEKFDLNGGYISSYRMEKLFVTFSMLSDGRLVAPILNMQGIPGIPGSEDDKTLLSLLDTKGKIVANFGALKEYDNPMLTGMANMVSVAVDDKDNIFLCYVAENRIEKYDSRGELIFRFDRPLPFEIHVGMSEREMDFGGRVATIPFPDITFISGAAGVDSKNRLWVATFHEQPELPSELTRMQSATFPESIHLEIYDSEGIWLGTIDPPSDDLNFSIMQGNTVFFHDKDLVSIHEYRIVER